LRYIDAGGDENAEARACVRPLESLYFRTIISQAYTGGIELNLLVCEELIAIHLFEHIHKCNSSICSDVPGKPMTDPHQTLEASGLRPAPFIAQLFAPTASPSPEMFLSCLQ